MISSLHVIWSLWNLWHLVKGWERFRRSWNEQSEKKMKSYYDDQKICLITFGDNFKFTRISLKQIFIQGFRTANNFTKSLFIFDEVTQLIFSRIGHHIFLLLGRSFQMFIFWVPRNAWINWVGINWKLVVKYVCILDILFSSNQEIHKSSHGLYFWASDPLIEIFY